MRHPLRATAIVAAVTFVAPAHAQSYREKIEAQKAARAGKLALRQGKFDEAASKLEEANGVMDVPSWKLDQARALIELQRLRDAGEVAEACAAQESVRQWAEKQAQKKCAELIEELDQRTPKLSLSVFEPSADQVTVEVDGEEVDVDQPLRLDPGEHAIVAKAEGYETFTDAVTLGEGDDKGLEIKMTALVTDTGPEEGEDDDEGGGFSPVPAYISWGVGAVGLGVGIGFGIAAIQSTNDILRVYECSSTSVCQASTEAERQQLQDDLDTSKLNGNLSTAGFVIGIAGVLGGTALYLVHTFSDGEDEGAEEEEARVTPVVGPGFVGVTGTF